jgi:hypothetical protein
MKSKDAYQSNHFGSFPIFINSNMQKSLIGFVGARKKKISGREKCISKVQIMDVLTFMCIVLLVGT